MMPDETRTPAGFCPHCGYPIDGGRCPECGREVPAEQLDTVAGRTRRRRRNRWITLVSIVTVVLGGGSAAYHYVDWMAVAPTSVLILRDRLRTAPTTWLVRLPIYAEIVRRSNLGKVTPAQREKYLRGRVSFELKPPDRQPDPDFFVIHGIVNGVDECWADGWPNCAPRLEWNAWRLQVDGKLVAESHGRGVSCQGMGACSYSSIETYCIPRLPPGPHEIVVAQDIEAVVHAPSPGTSWMAEAVFTASRTVVVEKP